MKKTPINTGPVYPESDSLDSEIAVIGSGPGGSLTACLLAEAGREVLLIEEGPYLYQSSSEPFSIEEMESKYRHGGITFAAGRPKVTYVEGRCVGGGSEINSCLYHRPAEDTLNRWSQEYRVDSLGCKNLEDIFLANERELSVTDSSGDASMASLRLENGAAMLGWNSIAAPRFFKDAVFDMAGTQNTGRQSMTKTFLPRFMNAGGSLIADARVTQFKKQPRGAGWIIHAGLTDKRRISIRAKSIFLAAGAIQTPALLRRSGISNNIGNSLRLHPTVKVVAEFSEKVNSRLPGVPARQVKHFAPGYSFGCSVSSLPYVAMALVNHPGRLAGIEEKWEYMAIYYVAAAAGRGSVRQTPFFSAPVVHYVVGHEGLCSLSDGLKDLCRLLLAAGATALYPTIAGMPPVHRAADINTIPRPLPADGSNLMSVHLMGTCPMGENTSRCAVDSFGKVHGFDGLYINDASIFCDGLGLNPQGTIMALARRNVLHFLNV